MNSRRNATTVVLAALVALALVLVSAVTLRPETAPATPTAPSCATPTPTSTPTTPSPSPTPTGPSGQPAPNANLPGWKLWHVDDFNTFDTTRWTKYQGTSGAHPNTSAWLASHATVAGSVLTLRGYRDAASAYPNRFGTAGVGMFKGPKPPAYTRVEARVRVDAGANVHYAFLAWPSGVAWPKGGEIDYAESGIADRSTTTATWHYANTVGTHAQIGPGRVAVPNTMATWHTVGYEWVPGEIRFLLDGKVWRTVTSPTVTTGVPMVPVFQTEATSLTGQPAKVDAQVDWVAVWERG